MPHKNTDQIRVSLRAERQFLPPDNFQKIPSLLLFSLKLGNTGSRPKEQRGSAPADSMDLLLGHARRQMIPEELCEEAE